MSNLSGTDPNAAATQLVAEGRIVDLVEVRAASLADAVGAGVAFHVGIDGDGDPSDNFSGAEEFAIDPAHPSVELVGEIHGGELVARLGEAPLQIAMLAWPEPFVLTLQGAAVEITVDAGQLSGRLGGVVGREEVHDEILTVVWRGFLETIHRDCTGGVCPSSSDGQSLLDLLHANRDSNLSLREVRDNDLTDSLFSPDLDVFDAEGRHNPGCEGSKESLSFGVSFTAVPAVF
jgi:hypothetical protein